MSLSAMYGPDPHLNCNSILLMRIFATTVLEKTETADEAVLEYVRLLYTTHAHNRSNHLCAKYVPLVFHSEFYKGHLKKEYT